MKLPDIIRELGGLGALTASQLATVQDRTAYLFRLINLGGAMGTQALQTLDATLVDMANTAVAAGEPVSQFFLDMAAAARAVGIHLDRVQAFFMGQANTIASGLGDLLTMPMLAADAAIAKAVADATKALDELKASGTATAQQLAIAQQRLTDALTAQHAAALTNEDALADLGTTALLTFNALIAAGETWAHALAKIAPQLDIIAQAYADLGIEASDPAVKGLLLEHQILNGPGGTGKAIAGQQSIFEASRNIPGLLTPAVFESQERLLDKLYTQTQAATAAAGGTTINALASLQPLLHELDKWAKDHNLVLDEQTQQRIDQSKELGLWEADFRTDAEKSRDSMAELIASNTNLIAALGGLASAITVLTAVPTSTGTPEPVVAQAEGGMGYASGPMTFLPKVTRTGPSRVRASSGGIPRS